ncbi:MAG: hypothetical protein IJE81_05575 [Oscillospiraceae bacterium]|nr:hypothetical protein [Oscillospiraceae bacterium]
MGISILEQVLQLLRSAEFQADVAYPGQKFPQITRTVAAVHIEKVDRANMTVTLEVNIISPAALGGTACELEALRATEVLQWDGAVCIQNGCTYDGSAQVYVVAVLATYTCVTEADSCTLGPGFRIYINDIRQPFAVAFAEEAAFDHTAVYEMGEADPMGISLGSRIWKITLEEHILPGSPEAAEPAGAFELKVQRDAATEMYYHCRWQSIRREMDRSGLRRIRKGIAMAKEVA